MKKILYFVKSKKVIFGICTKALDYCTGTCRLYIYSYQSLFLRLIILPNIFFTVALFFFQK